MVLILSIFSCRLLRQVDSYFMILISESSVALIKSKVLLILCLRSVKLPQLIKLSSVRRSGSSSGNSVQTSLVSEQYPILVVFLLADKKILHAQYHLGIFHAVLSDK